jgi:hypothetical protein
VRLVSVVVSHAQEDGASLRHEDDIDCVNVVVFEAEEDADAYAFEQEERGVKTERWRVPVVPVMFE